MNRTPLAPVAGWPAELADHYRSKGYWQGENLDRFLTTRVCENGHRTAVVGATAADPSSRVTLTYEQLHERVGRLATAFAAEGVGAGDRVVVQLPNCVEYVVAVFAIFRLGALPVFALPSHREVELEQFCRTSDAAAHVVAGSGWGHDFIALAESVGRRLRAGDHEPPVVIDLVGLDVDHLPCAPASTAGAEEVAFLQLSGGTTGTSKLIPRTHADYLYSVRESATICDVNRATVMLVVLPAAHNFPMSSPGLLGVLDRGGAVVLAPDASPRTALSLVESERVTMASLVPPLLHAWLSTAARGRHDISSLQRIQVGGARLADAVAARVGAELGAQLQQVFGMAEGLVCYTRVDDPDGLVTTTQGRPISPDDEIRVVDDEDHDVAPGEEGHLLTRGPYTIRGYYRADAHNQESFTSDGFYRTGDLVRRLPTGHLQVTGRSKDQINRGGEKIAVDEVENFLVSHPQVFDAVVVSVPDEYLGERVCAFIVAEGQPPNVDGLKDFLRDAGLATFKIPDRIDVIDALPTTGVGKTSRRDVRRLISSQLQTTN